ncbi:MAG: hypothetical protein OK436_07285 [Thaumarchaeota archaeon]|nr:hypothetical protein [Nitrososphaerota archaeon]
MTSAQRYELLERLMTRVKRLEAQVQSLREDNQRLHWEAQQARELVASTIELSGRD